MTNEGDRFIQGIAYSVAWLISAYHAEAIAIDMLESSGYTYQDLVRAKCDDHDLEIIAQALAQD